MSRDEKKEFIRILDGLDRSKGRVENFRNFNEMAYCSLAKTTTFDEEQAQKLEDRYMDIVGMYSNKDHVREMPKLLSTTTLALSRGGCDFLGSIAGEIEALDSRNGQFFTPYDVSYMMAKMTLVGMEELVEKEGFISISDPAAGAGCMLLASADFAQATDPELIEDMSAHAIELNRMTYHMLYVQLAVRGIAAQVIHGNALTLEFFESAYTPAVIPFMGKHGRLFKDSPRNEPIVKPDEPKTGGQLTLF